MSSYATGRNYEQELVNRFKADGYGALRLGASGGGGDADLPDVFAGKRELTTEHTLSRSTRRVLTDAMAVELKSGKADILYVEPEEVDALKAFCRDWGATAHLGVRSTQQATPTETFLIEPGAARRTDSGRYAVDVDGVGGLASVVVGEDGVVWRD